MSIIQKCFISKETKINISFKRRNLRDNFNDSVSQRLFNSFSNGVQKNPGIIWIFNKIDFTAPY